MRVLGMISSPRGLPALDIDGERERLEEALRPHLDSGRVELEWLDEVSWTGVHGKLLEGQWHVLHFVGHGTYDVDTDEGVLAFVGRDGRADYVTASSLADLLDEAEPTPRLVVLNSCQSGAGGTTDLFSGTAAALAHSGIRAVAAMQFSISDTAAIEFARGFYTALAHGRGIDEAVRSGRIGILGMGRGTLEWVTPVLYLRGEDTQLFDVAPLSPAELETPKGSADEVAPIAAPATVGATPAGGLDDDDGADSGSCREARRIAPGRHGDPCRHGGSRDRADRIEAVHDADGTDTARSGTDASTPVQLRSADGGAVVDGRPRTTAACRSSHRLAAREAAERRRLGRRNSDHPATQLRAADLQAAGLRSAGLRPTELRATELRATELRPAEPTRDERGRASAVDTAVEAVARRGCRVDRRHRRRDRGGRPASSRFGTRRHPDRRARGCARPGWGRRPDAGPRSTRASS